MVDEYEEGFMSAGISSNTGAGCLSITVLTDGESWINEYIPDLVSSFTLSGHDVSWVHEISEITEGELSFYLGCGKIVPPDVLSKNRHNLVVHASALPQGRGWSPLTWQILEGRNEIPISLFEAERFVDSGKIYIRDVMRFDGTELIGELRQKAGEYTVRLCRAFVENYPNIVLKGANQAGTSSYYRKRSPEDSRLDPDRTIREQFNLMRVVDNEHYPARFELNGAQYTLRIEKGWE
jgi:methionyl-tRNA formyltransferase